MATPTPHPIGIPGDVLHALCDPAPDATTAAVRRMLLAADRQTGAVLEAAIDSKMLCLLADRLARSGLDQRLSRGMRRFLASALRANRYKTGVYRKETARLTTSFHRDGVPVAVINGLAVETQLYHGRGTRQFSDIDLLVAPDAHAVAHRTLDDLGYRAPHRAPRSRRRVTDDGIVPEITVDLHSGLTHTSAPEEIATVLRRTVDLSVPDGIVVPVLADRDALPHALGRAIAKPSWPVYADALRYLHSAPDAVPAGTLGAAALAGLVQLRTLWPYLPKPEAVR